MMSWEEFEAKLGAVMVRLNPAVQGQIGNVSFPMIAVGLCQHIFIHSADLEHRFPGEIAWFREQMTHLATEGVWDVNNDPHMAIYWPDFGNDRECQCGHPYIRHFDPFENNDPVGCKYCQCERFQESQ
jgi:hypothetical protein